jgi:hypothetical protein
MKARSKAANIDRAGVVEAIRRAGKKLGRAPNWAELRLLTEVPQSRVRVFFGSLAEAVRAAALEPSGRGLKIDGEELLRDFARVQEKLGKRPSRNEYVKHGKYSAGSFYARYGSWKAIADRLTAEDGEEHRGEKLWPQKAADERGLTRIESVHPMPNGSALKMDSGGVKLARLNRNVTSGGVLYEDRPVMGPPFEKHALRNAPVNELGVVFLFGMLAGELGFQVDSVWGRYPDIEAWRQIQPGKWQRVRIEVEYESANFARHGHDPEKCDVIVCWKHNWKNCPKHIEVIELSKIVATT